MSKIKNILSRFKKPLFIILTILVVILFIASGVLGYFLYTTDKNLKSTKDELSKTQQTLKETEDAKAALEEEKITLNQKITELTSNTAKLEADMAAKQAELQSINANLANAQKCVALFDSVKGQLASYNSNLEKSGELVWQAIEAAANGNEPLADQLIQQAINYSNKARANYNSMNGTLNKIKSGKC